MRITRRQLRQIIKEVTGGMRERPMVRGASPGEWIDPDEPTIPWDQIEPWSFLEYVEEADSVTEDDLTIARIMARKHRPAEEIFDAMSHGVQDEYVQAWDMGLMGDFEEY